MFTLLFTELLPSAGLPPVRCNLYNSINSGLAPFVGELLGLSSFGILIVAVLLVGLIFVGFIARQRARWISALCWIIGILIVGTVVLNAAGVIIPSACG